MALTKVSGGILDPGINVAGIVTATGFDGPFTGGTGSNINAGIITATGFDLNGNGDISGNLVIGGNLTANGDFTTLNTTLREVEILRVDANTTAVAGIITQRGSGDIFSAYDTSTQVFKIADGGDITFFGGSNSKNASWDYSTNTLSFDGNGSVNNQYAQIQFGSASKSMKLYNNLNNFINVNPNVALFVESADFQIYGSGSRGGTTYDGTIFIAREGVIELGHEVGGGGATGTKLKTVGYGVTILGTTETQKLNVTGISTLTGDVGVGANLSVAGIATVTTRLNINTVSGTRLAVAGTNYPWRGMFMIKDTSTGASAQPYMTFWDGSEANDGSNTGLLGRAGHVNGGATNERFDFWTYRSTTPLSLGTNGNERLRITPAGQVLIVSHGGNAISARTVLSNYTPALQIEGNSKSTSAASLTANLNNAVGPSLWFAKTRGTAISGGNTAVQDDDELGTIVFNGADGTDIQNMGAYIRGEVDGSVSSNDVPGRLQFHTATGGTMYERLRITSGGKVGINLDDNTTADLQVCTPNTAHGLLRIGGNNTNGVGIDIDYSNSGHTKTTFKQNYRSNQATAEMSFESGFFTFISGTGSDERLRILSNGNVVLGHTAANARLHIASGTNSAVGDATNPAFQIGATGNYRFAIHTTNEQAIIANKNGDDGIAFHTKTANSGSFGEALRITSSGILQTTQDYPTFRPTLDFNFAAEKKLDPRITYTRTGPASFTDEFGRVILVGENVPRFDHDPITRECKGLLIEETRTNKISNSNSWNDGVVTDETKSPDGEFNAIKVIGSEGGTTYNEGTSTTGVWSVFLKAGSTNYVQLQGGGVGMNNSTIGPYTKNSIINLSDGTFTVNEQNFTAEQYRDGWWRVSVVYTTGGSYQGTTWSIYCLDSSSPSADTVDNAEHCYVWGEVYEVGSSISSYIPTKYGSATRGDDDLIIDGEDFIDFLNPSEGTIFADYKVIAEDPEIMYLSDNTAARRIGLYEAGSSQTRFLIGNSGTLADTTDSAGTTVGDNIKSAGAYKLNDVAAAKNGVISSTDSSVTIPPDLDRAYIGGYYDGTVQGILGLRRLVYYQQRLPNSQLIALTA